MTLAPPRPATEAGALRHRPIEDALALLIGTFVVSLGMHLLHAAHAVTGGTAGLALLLTYATRAPLGVLYLVITLPFLIIAYRMKGWRFTVRTLLAITLVSVFTSVHPVLLVDGPLTGGYGVLAGNLLAGLGMLVIFRHGGSLGGFNTIALIAQERLGVKAGLVQSGLDCVVILVSLSVVPPLTVALSAAGAMLLGLVLGLNHRPDRYLGR